MVPNAVDTRVIWMVVNERAFVAWLTASFLHLKSFMKQRKQRFPPLAAARLLRLDTISPWVLISRSFSLPLAASSLGYSFCLIGTRPGVTQKEGYRKFTEAGFCFLLQ